MKGKFQYYKKQGNSKGTVPGLKNRAIVKGQFQDYKQQGNIKGTVPGLQKTGKHKRDSPGIKKNRAIVKGQFQAHKNRATLKGQFQEKIGQH